ncbi:hypothetical protein [Streptomyces acidicola]|uniref:Uncharacterized protein n=1 Tax=Streptomyces acidicola TaxID=2596892 RepID=A0A5N8WMV2_9ACTN|nr:hypothetical protein [Streptomyces acidicola]MPY48770.1 hypothetical protein [Streptomyces acidicola]
MTTSPPERFHLTMASAGHPTMHGWWPREATARHKFATWVGSWGKPGARVTLADVETGTMLAT